MEEDDTDDSSGDGNAKSVSRYWTLKELKKDKGMQEDAMPCFMQL